MQNPEVFGRFMKEHWEADGGIIITVMLTLAFGKVFVNPEHAMSWAGKLLCFRGAYANLASVRSNAKPSIPQY